MSHIYIDILEQKFISVMGSESNKKNVSLFLSYSITFFSVYLQSRGLKQCLYLYLHLYLLSTPHIRNIEMLALSACCMNSPTVSLNAPIQLHNLRYITPAYKQSVLCAGIIFACTRIHFLCVDHRAVNAVSAYSAACFC